MPAQSRMPAARQRAMPKKTGICNFLDPLCPMPAPAVLSDGKALPHTGLVSGDFQVGTTDTTLLLVTNTGDSGTVGTIINVDSEGTYTNGFEMFTIPTLAAEDSNGGASASRAMKLSVSVVNCTNALKRGGRVTYLNSSQRLPARGTEASTGAYAGVIGGVKNSPYRRRIMGDTLAVAKHLIGFPVDSVTYSSFKPHRGTLSFGSFMEHVLAAGVQDTAPAPRPMSVVAFIFDPASDSQDYSVTIRASYYTRWPLTSVPGQSMSNIPTAHPAVVNHVRDHAESRANDLAHVTEGGAIALAAPRVAASAQAAGRSMLSRIGSALGRGAAAAAETIEGAAGVVLEEGLVAAEYAAPAVLL